MAQPLLAVHQFPGSAPRAVLAVQFEWDSHGSFAKNTVKPVLVDDSALKEDAKEFRTRDEPARVLSVRRRCFVRLRFGPFLVELHRHSSSSMLGSLPGVNTTAIADPGDLRG